MSCSPYIRGDICLVGLTVRVGVCGSFFKDRTDSSVCVLYPNCFYFLKS